MNRIFALTLPALMVILNLSSVAVLWFGGRLVSEGSMPIGNLTAFLTYILQILMSVMMAVMMVILLPRAVASAERVEEVLGTAPSIVDPPRPVRPAAVDRASWSSRTSRFGYPGSERPVLRRPLVHVPAGRDERDHRRDRQRQDDAAQPDPAVLRRHRAAACSSTASTCASRSWSSCGARLGLVPQAAFLFSGTVASNLRFGKPEATDAELWHALEIAQARDFVAAMPGQLDAPIDQGGTTSPAGSASGCRSPGRW